MKGKPSTSNVTLKITHRTNLSLVNLTLNLVLGNFALTLSAFAISFLFSYLFRLHYFICNFISCIFNSSCILLLIYNFFLIYTFFRFHLSFFFLLLIRNCNCYPTNNIIKTRLFLFHITLNHTSRFFISPSPIKTSCAEYLNSTRCKLFSISFLLFLLINRSVPFSASSSSLNCVAILRLVSSKNYAILVWTSFKMYNFWLFIKSWRKFFTFLLQIIKVMTPVVSLVWVSLIWLKFHHKIQSHRWCHLLKSIKNLRIC